MSQSKSAGEVIRFPLFGAIQDPSRLMARLALVPRGSLVNVLVVDELPESQPANIPLDSELPETSLDGEDPVKAVMAEGVPKLEFPNIGLIIFPTTQTVRGPRGQANITPLGFRILHLLAQTPDLPVEEQSILDACWYDRPHPVSNVVSKHISETNAALGVAGAGYHPIRRFEQAYWFNPQPYRIEENS